MSKLKGRSQHPGRKGRSLRPDQASQYASARPPDRDDTTLQAASGAGPSSPPPSVAASDAIAAEIRARFGTKDDATEKTPADEASAAGVDRADDAGDRGDRSSPPSRRDAAKDAPARSSRPAARSSRPPEKGKAARSASRHDAEYDDEPSHSLSAEFFRRDVESLPPHVDYFHDHAEEPDHDHVHLLSPAALERRARFRRIVAAVVGFAGVVSIAVVGRAVTARPRPHVAPAPVALIAPPPIAAQPSVAAIPAPEPTPAPTAQSSAVVEAPVASAVPSASASASAPEPVASAKAEPEKKDEKADAPKGDGDPVALRKEALKLLNMGKTKDSIPIARAAIAADPSDATAYLYLGSALQDSGKWKDGIEIYCDCVRTATKGPVNECRQMGGHK